ncbi:MAG TPA: T9SS type A sorting domain-containing protein, partial [Paludibacter sp.]|nr:T9SS type A sorting domain-containing protein [Paludibacter sp.]
LILLVLRFLGVSGQTSTLLNDSFAIYPANPTYSDSVVLSYKYISNDGCPDFYFTEDSVSGNKIYVSLNKINDSDRICIQVVSIFIAKINLGVFYDSKQLYVDGKYFRTINVRCGMDKNGIVISCGGMTFIQDISSPPAMIQLYKIKEEVDATTGVAVKSVLNVGDKVYFGGYRVQNSPVSADTCRYIGIATCYELMDTATVCVPDRKGVVVNCNGQLFVEDLSVPYASVFPYLYRIKDAATDTYPNALKEGDKLVFKAVPDMKDSVSGTSCRTFGYVLCYKVLEPTPGCILDKKGILIDGMPDCNNSALLIKEILTGYLYSIKPNVATDATVTFEPVLKPGDRVVFGGYLIKNDSTKDSNCLINGIAECYRLIDTVPTCVMDRKGVVERGVDSCANLLFVKEEGTGMLFYITPQEEVYTTGFMTRGLNAGDKVKFKGVLIYTLDGFVNFCNASGIVKCYELIESAHTYTLAGKTLAGADTVKSGLVVLFEKSYRKAIAISKISEGVFQFKGLPQSDYTVYVIPEKSFYNQYLPTFYIDKLYYRFADFVSLRSDTAGLVVKMRKFVPHDEGTGRIYGNVFFEYNRLNDTLLVKNALLDTYGTPDYALAVNATVLLLNRYNEPVAWTLTDVNGNYMFDKLPVDSFTVVSETANAFAYLPVELTNESNDANADMMLKDMTGVSRVNNPESPDLIIYPNPAHEKFIVLLSEDTRIKIYNVAGQLVLVRNLFAGENTVETGNLKPGVYIIHAGNRMHKLLKN